MPLIYQASVVVVALLHLGFLILEMFLWTTPTGLKTFGMTQAMAESTKVLAMNQGLYNGFLSAGLLFGLFTADNKMMMFFLICVAIAGIYGACTANPKIFWIQALPALIAIGLGYFSRGSV